MGVLAHPFRQLRRVVLWLALALAVFGSAPALADDAAASAPAALSACTARVLPGDRPELLLASPARFDCSTRQASLGPGSYWLRLPLPPGLTPQQRVLSFVPAWQQSAALYYRSTAGQLARLDLSNRALSEHGRIGARSAFVLDPAPAPGGALLLRIDGAINASGLIQLPRIESERSADRAELGEGLAYAAFAGVALALLAYNLLMWLAMRERFQLAYCTTLVAMLAYNWSHSGALDLEWPLLGAQLRLRFSYLALAAIAVSAQRFLVDCIEPECLPPALRRAVRWDCWAIATIGIAVPLAPPGWEHLLDRCYVAAFVPVPLVMTAVGITAWRRGSRIVRLLTLAWSPPLVMALVRIAHSSNLIGYSLWVEHSVLLAMGIESLLSAFALTSRIKLITRERDRARAEEAAARSLANIDPLTGLLNRRALLDHVMALGGEGPLRLILIDIDHFKAINDRHGHDTGDEVLRAVAQSLAIRAAFAGSVARIGGEEFAVLGRADSMSDALALGLLAEVRAAAMPHGQQVTISIGIAQGPVGCEPDWRKLYREADAALYEAKQGGRNRLVTAEPARAAA